jgi:hypothetical protein
VELATYLLSARCATRGSVKDWGDSAIAISSHERNSLVRFWTLAMLAYVFLEEERQRLQIQELRPATIGEARRELQRRLRRKVLLWLHGQFQYCVQPEALYGLFAV